MMRSQVVMKKYVMMKGRGRVTGGLLCPWREKLAFWINLSQKWVNEDFDTQIMKYQYNEYNK